MPFRTVTDQKFGHQDPENASIVLGIMSGETDWLIDRSGGLMAATGSAGSANGAPQLRWWVGAADRWHRPETAGPTAVTQTRIEGLPLVETGLRIPGGQLVQRSYAFANGTETGVVVEWENRSRDAVALAVAVTGGQSVRFDGVQKLAGEGIAVVVPRVPAALSAGGDVEAVYAEVAAGNAGSVAAVEAIPSGAGSADNPTVALVFPLAHTAILRVVVLDEDGDASLAQPPEWESLLRGWHSHIDNGLQLELPDELLLHTIVAARSTLLIRCDRPRPVVEQAAVTRALALWGHERAALIAGQELIGSQRLNGSFTRPDDPAVTAQVVASWAALAQVGTSPSNDLDELVGPVAKAAYRLGKQAGRSSEGWWNQAQTDAATFLEIVNQPDAAELCRQRVRGARITTVDPWAEVQAAAEAFRNAGTATVVPAAARFLIMARTLLCNLSKSGGDSGISLMSRWPDEWLGQPLAVHQIPAGGRTFAFAVRWHGARPAILWEHSDSTAPTTVRVPGLDPAWSSREIAGEALLAPVEPAGGLPKVVAPLQHDGTPADLAAEGGPSFQ